MNLGRAHDYVMQCFSGESDDRVLACHICQLKFTSLHNKQSHYSGKLHLQTVIQNLDQLMQDKSRNDQSVDCLPGSNDESGKGVVSSLQMVAKGYHSKSD